MAIKEIDKRKLSAGDMELLSEEISILKTIKHRYVLKFIDSFHDKTFIYIITERLEGEELFYKIKDSKKLPEN